MLGYLKKFNILPAELKRKVSSPLALAELDRLEKKYGLPLAALVMRVMVKEIALDDLVSYLVKENLSQASAGRLAEELKERIFFSSPDNSSIGLATKTPDSRPKKPAAEIPPNKANPPKTPASRPPVSPGGSDKVELKSPKAEPANDKKPASQSLIQGSGFFFSADDEAEIRELSKKIAWAERTDLSDAIIEEKLKEIIERTQINFGSADLVARFRQILKTYLRGIRNKLETKSALIKPFLKGGLSFDEDSAEKVMRLADQILNAQAGEIIKPLAKIKIPELAERDVPYDFSTFADQQKTSVPKAVSAVKPEIKLRPDPAPEPVRPKPARPILSEKIDHELAPLTPAAVNYGFQKNLKSRPKEKISPVFPAAKIKPRAPDNLQAANPMPIIRRRFEADNLNLSQKVKVEDVKYVPKVMSPLDELKYLDLVNFRRLDKEPTRAVEKIISKIDLLAEENYGKRLEGIRLWRSSPVNKLYLAIGQMSISENKPIDVIIEERKIKGGDYLTAAEFEAIMDLNKSLRF